MLVFRALTMSADREKRQGCAKLKVPWQGDGRGNLLGTGGMQSEGDRDPTHGVMNAGLTMATR